MTQLSLFEWNLPAPPKKRWPAYGFYIWRPCECGSTHRMTWITEPYQMISLKHWRISKRRVS